MQTDLANFPSSPSMQHHPYTIRRSSLKETLQWATLQVCPPDDTSSGVSCLLFSPLSPCITQDWAWMSQLPENPPKYQIWSGISLLSLLFSYIFLFSTVITYLVFITFDAELPERKKSQISSLYFQLLTESVPHGRCPIICLAEQVNEWMHEYVTFEDFLY